MKFNLKKVLSIGLLASMLGGLISVQPVFAETITKNTIETTIETTNKLVPKGVKIPGKEVVFDVYTYSNAPEDVKADYEANCKAANVIPAASDEILIPTTSNNIKPAKNSVLSTVTATETVAVSVTAVYYNASTGQITAEMKYTSAAGYMWTVYSYAYISDYIGYGHITNGDKVKCLQAVLDYQFGYSLAVDGSFGPNTQNAVLNVQFNHRLSEDGIVGPATWKAILGI